MNCIKCGQQVSDTARFCPSCGTPVGGGPSRPTTRGRLIAILGGVAFGWIMNRYGLLPCLVGHYLLDAFLTARRTFLHHLLGVGRVEAGREPGARLAKSLFAA